ncbi:MAG: glycosyltransferase family 4 protein [Candidatus Omnitrophota bacterium]
MSKTRLLYIITKLELGGAQKQLLSLISGISKDEFEIFLFTCRHGLLVNDALKSVGRNNFWRSLFLEREINPFKDFIALLEIYCFIKAKRIEIVHTHSSKAGVLGRLAARLARVSKVVHTVHGWSFNNYQPYLVRWMFLMLEKICEKHTDKIIVVSNFDRIKGLSLGIGNYDKYTLINYGIDFTEFKARQRDTSLIKDLGIKENELIVGMIACFKSQKAPLDFIKLAFRVNKVFPDAKFILIGDGILRKRIERFISELNLSQRVILTGWQKDIPSLLSIMDVFVLTSLWEGMPIAVIEAMALARPVLATDTGGVSEVLVDNQTGFLASLFDIAKMSDKLIYLLNNPQLRECMGKKAQISLDERYHVGSMIGKTLYLYQEM